MAAVNQEPRGLMNEASLGTARTTSLELAQFARAASPLVVEIAKLLSVLSRTMKQALFISSIVQGGRKRRGLLTFDAQPSRRLRDDQAVGNYQLQAGRPSSSGAKVRHGMRGQRDARLNLDLHTMTKAPESQMHVVDRVGCVLRPTDHNAVAQRKRAPTGDSPAEAPGRWARQAGHPPGSLAWPRRNPQYGIQSPQDGGTAPRVASVKSWHSHRNQLHSP
jgi:hypothetical protein